MVKTAKNYLKSVLLNFFTISTLVCSSMIAKLEIRGGGKEITPLSCLNRVAKYLGSHRFKYFYCIFRIGVVYNWTIEISSICAKVADLCGGRLPGLHWFLLWTKCIIFTIAYRSVGSFAMVQVNA